MTALLKLMGLRDWIIVALLLAVVAANWRIDLESSRADRAERAAQGWKSAHEQLTNNLKEAQAAADAKQKEHEDELQERVTAAREQERAVAAQNERRLRAAVAAERADAASLREQLADRLGRAAEASPDPAASRDDAAASVGDVLAEALRVQGELATAAEGHAAEVRSLLESWPVSDR